jgi:hypothetical protein
VAGMAPASRSHTGLIPPLPGLQTGARGRGITFQEPVWLFGRRGEYTFETHGVTDRARIQNCAADDK